MARNPALVTAVLLAIAIWSPFGAGQVPWPAARADTPSPGIIREARPGPAAIGLPKPLAASSAPADHVVPVHSAPVLRGVNPPFGDGDGLSGAAELLIRFVGTSELSGKYRIDANTSIAIPVVGRVSVASMDAAQLERLLAEKVSRYVGRKIYVAVEIATYRRVFVSGLVARPTSHEWRPSMTVFECVALAGGLPPLAAGGSASILGDEVVLAGLRKAIVKQAQYIAVLARLQAERNGADSIVVPESLVELVGADRAAAAVRAQNSAMASSRALLNSRKVALTRAISSARKRLADLEPDLGRLRYRDTTHRNFNLHIGSLVSHGAGVVVGAADGSARRDLEGERSSNDPAVIEVNNRIAERLQDRTNLETDWRAQIDRGIIEFKRNISEQSIEIEKAREAYRRLTGERPSNDTASALVRNSVVTYKIVRQTAQGTQTLTAAPFTAIAAGDVIMVALER
jgi:exopolysaccharide production protein ExoF